MDKNGFGLCFSLILGAVYGLLCYVQNAYVLYFMGAYLRDPPCGPRNLSVLVADVSGYQQVYGVIHTTALWEHWRAN